MKSKKDTIVVSVKSGDRDLLSFNVSDFKNVKEANDALNHVARILTGLLVSATFTAMSEETSSGHIDDIVKVANNLMDALAENTKDNILKSLKAFLEDQNKSKKNYGGNA